MTTDDRYLKRPAKPILDSYINHVGHQSLLWSIRSRALSSTSSFAFLLLLSLLPNTELSKFHSRSFSGSSRSPTQMTPALQSPLSAATNYHARAGYNAATLVWNIAHANEGFLNNSLQQVIFKDHSDSHYMIMSASKPYADFLYSLW